MQTIATILLQELRNSEYCELMAEVKDLLPGVLPAGPKVDPLLNQFGKTYEDLDLANRVDTGSVLTPKVHNANDKLSSTWKGMDHIIDGHLHSSKPAQLESAKVIRRVFDVYGDFRRNSLAAQSSDARNLIQDLELPENQEHCNNIKLTAWIETYKTRLGIFKDYMRERDEEMSHKGSGDVRAVRTVMDPIFREIIKMVLAYVTVGLATPEIENFIIMMNQKAKRYNDMVAMRKGRHKDPEPEVEQEINEEED